MVENIVGVTQYDFDVKGSADHAGTTSMTMRKDALTSSARIILEIEKIERDRG